MRREATATEYMVEVVVGHHQVIDRRSGKRPHIIADPRSLRKRCTAVDQQLRAGSAHQTDRDVEERQPTAVHRFRQRFPAVIHRIPTVIGRRRSRSTSGLQPQKRRR